MGTKFELKQLINQLFAQLEVEREWFGGEGYKNSQLALSDKEEIAKHMHENMSGIMVTCDKIRKLIDKL